MPNDLRPVPLLTLTNLITHIFISWEQQQAELGEAAGPKIGAAYSDVDERIIEVFGQLQSRLEKIEAATKFQKTAGRAVRRRTACLRTARVLQKPCTPSPSAKYFRKRLTDGAEAFAAAVAEYGAPAVLAGGDSDRSDGIDMSAYGFFSVAVHGAGVMAELEGLTSQVKAMEEKVVGCGAPPFGMRPHFVVLACFIGLLAFRMAGVAAGIAGNEIDNDDIYNSVTTETPVMCVGQMCIYSGFDTLSSAVQDRLLVVVGSALAAGGPVGAGGESAAAWCMVVLEALNDVQGYEWLDGPDVVCVLFGQPTLVVVEQVHGSPRWPSGTAAWVTKAAYGERPGREARISGPLLE
ncbi:hypothetical protein CYMTET_19012 [Cymbomonas tetramitiformis]|uniref:Uncharacterized protein n=1 Tax=Cymbomonas tetramitiformis TaxID=36881 RepID=A0AAE0G7J9_9CHLO|nr:hypothetical protein CYMTET_19012 [Cymbomonas tetramitiformis]